MADDLVILGWNRKKERDRKPKTPQEALRDDLEDVPERCDLEDDDGGF